MHSQRTTGKDSDAHGESKPMKGGEYMKNPFRSRCFKCMKLKHRMKEISYKVHQIDAVLIGKAELDSTDISKIATAIFAIDIEVRKE